MSALPGVFDLIICDEAHRTTGVTLSDEDESAFVRVHDNDFIRAKKRLYMTATPRLYHDSAKKTAADINKLIGCVNALSKEIIGDNGVTRAADPAPMSTAVAFCRSIKTSKEITATFNRMGELYYSQLPSEAQKKLVNVSCDHVDGTMSAPTREQKLAWLKSAERDTYRCNILSNVRCLSEGVDVPSLDAVMFLSARNSQVDVVQSVGRVMRCRY